MLFQDKDLRSTFDMDAPEPDQEVTLKDLAIEIERITDTLYQKWKTQKVVYFEEESRYIDMEAVHPGTWVRDINNILQILVRHPDKNGDYPHQFSINKALSSMGIEESDSFDYYRILYLLYMVNYFAFPKDNLFLYWTRMPSRYDLSYDEGSSDGSPLRFLLSNILHHNKALLFSIEWSNQSLYWMDALAYKVGSDGDICLPIDNSWVNSYSIEEPFYNLIYFCHRYLVVSYCENFIDTLDVHQVHAWFGENVIPPFPSWKEVYIPVENVDEFIMSHSFYYFCTQQISSAPYKERQKLAQSNAVKNAKRLLEQDILQIQDGADGWLCEVKDHRIVIYALRLVIVVKTYIDLVNRHKVRLYMEGKKMPLGTALVKSNGKSAHGLSQRYFVLLCHIAYIYATKEDADEQVQEKIQVERTCLKLYRVAFSQLSWFSCLQVMKVLYDDL